MWYHFKECTRFEEDYKQNNHYDMYHYQRVVKIRKEYKFYT